VSFKGVNPAWKDQSSLSKRDQVNSVVKRRALSSNVVSTALIVTQFGVVVETVVGQYTVRGQTPVGGRAAHCMTP
jgi:hypothetical protein